MRGLVRIGAWEQLGTHGDAGGCGGGVRGPGIRPSFVEPVYGFGGQLSSEHAVLWQVGYEEGGEWAAVTAGEAGQDTDKATVNSGGC